MSGWIVFAGYLFFAALTYRKTYVMADEWNRREFPLSRDSSDRAMNAMMAMLVSTIWPITIAGWAVFRFLTPTAPGERKEDLDRREKEIARLERELGIEKGGKAEQP